MKASQIENMISMRFDRVDMPEFGENPQQTSSHRLTKAQMQSMPSGQDIIALRCALSTLFEEKLSLNYTKLEIKCDINRDTFQKVLKFRGGRNVSYNLLAKFCVGVGLTVDEATELFSLMDYQLSRRNLVDFILICNLENGGDVGEYLDDMALHGPKAKD